MQLKPICEFTLANQHHQQSASIFLATNFIYRNYKFMQACDLDIQNDFAIIKWGLIF